MYTCRSTDIECSGVVLEPISEKEKREKTEEVPYGSQFVSHAGSQPLEILKTKRYPDCMMDDHEETQKL